MMSTKPKVVMVNYLNSKPFEYGLSDAVSQGKIELVTAHPADCAAMFERREADIGLIPVGALKDMQDYRIISEYCIGCDGEVRTVCIMSQKPIDLCKKILLDTHSRTSVLLAQVILKGYFELDLPRETYQITDSSLSSDTAVLMIGDKVFEHEHKYRYVYDLGMLWKEMTGLPFVFAVWAAHTDTSLEADKHMNEALKVGIDHLDYIIDRESSENLDLYYYFKNNIQYNFDSKKQEALTLFWQYCRKMEEV